MLEWAKESDADFPGRVEPNAGKKAVGFDDGEAPAASEHNWLFGLAGDWIQWFDDVTTTLLDLVPFFARKDDSNAFTVGQLIDAENADVAMIATSTAPQTGDAANTWRPLVEAPLDGTRSIRLYYGSNDVGGLAALVVNAFWNSGTHLWAATDPLKESFALIVRRHVVTSKLCLGVSQRDAGAGTWAAWPTNAGDVAATNLRYTQTVVEQTQINVLDFTVLSGAWSVNPLSGAPEAGGMGDEMSLAFELPHGAQVNRVHVQHTQTSSTPNEFTVYARRKTDWPAPGTITPPANTLPVHGPSETRTTAIGPSAIALTPPAYSVSGTAFSVDNYSETYVLDCLAGAAGNAVLAVMVEWVNFGPVVK